MNLLLLETHDFLCPNRIQLSGRRADHIEKVLRSQVGDRLLAGVLGGNSGFARVIAIGHGKVTLELEALDTPPPPMLPITLVLGLPRPRMLQRTLQNVAAIGVQHLCLLQTHRVEKSFWQTPLLQHQTIRQQLLLGLEQARATQLPEVTLHRRFRPFVEGELPALASQTVKKWIAHPGDFPAASSANGSPTLLAIGPEGGFLDQEVAAFREGGLTPIQLGPRILKVETAVPLLLGKLFY